MKAIVPSRLIANPPNLSPRYRVRAHLSDPVPWRLPVALLPLDVGLAAELGVLPHGHLQLLPVAVGLPHHPVLVVRVRAAAAVHAGRRQQHQQQQEKQLRGPAAATDDRPAAVRNDNKQIRTKLNYHFRAN